ncbi:hypothetical protein ACO0SA_003505 [Hanseniaspora valbyensis]
MNINIFDDDFDDNQHEDDLFKLNKEFSNNLNLSVTPDNIGDSVAEIETYKETIEYFDYDIINFINYIINDIPCKDYKETGNIIIQMIRFKIDDNSNKESISSLIELLSDKVKLFIINEEKKTNLLTRSYWLGVINYLFFKMYKEADYNFFKLVPDCLEKLIDLMKFLMITSIDSINDQITNELIVNNILYFYEDENDFAINENNMKHELKYKDEKNWLWKHKKRNKLLLTSGNNTSSIVKRNSIENESNTTHAFSPPPIEEQASSPIKICHILNSLIYVLTENNISSIIQKQLVVFALTQIINKTFNNLMKDDFIKNRDRAIKIKLNLLMIQDWCKEQDFKNIVNKDFLSEIDDFILDTYPQNLLPDNYELLKNVYSFKQKSKFFYKTPLKIIFDMESCKLSDSLELLTIMSNFNDKEKHKDDFTSFVKEVTLNKQQLLKLIHGYRYEIDEPSFRFKKLIEKDILTPLGNNEDGLYLSETDFKQISKITIPFTKEIIAQYSNIVERVDQFYKTDLENIHEENLKKYGIPTNFNSDIRKPETMKVSRSLDQEEIGDLNGRMSTEGFPENIISIDVKKSNNGKELLSSSTLPVVSDYIAENPW